MALYIKVCVPLTPDHCKPAATILTAVFPARYGDVGPSFPGRRWPVFVMGAVNLATTYFQAAGRLSEGRHALGRRASWSQRRSTCWV